MNAVKLNSLGSRFNRDTPNMFVKYKLSCQDKLSKENPDTRDWLEIEDRINHESSEYVLFHALLEKKHRVVVKIGPLYMSQKEFMVGQELDKLSLPTFLSYNCLMQCLEDKTALKTTMTQSLCRTHGEPVGILVMPDLIGGTIDEWNWTKHNFYILQNLFKHIVASLSIASAQLKFVHRDLHYRNVRFIKTKRAAISYGDYGNLELFGLMPVIMDYDMSQIASSSWRDVYSQDMRRYLIHAATDSNIFYKNDKLTQVLSNLSSERTPPSPSICKQLWDAIDKMEFL